MLWWKPMNPDTSVERPKEKSEISRGIRKWWIKAGIGIVMVAAVLFVSSGRLDWTMGWVFLGVYLVFVLAHAAILMPKSPDLIAERSGLQKGTKAWDIVLASLAGVWVPAAIWIVAGLDVRFGRTAEIPLAFQIAALAIMVLGYALVMWAMAENRFFSATVRIQKERGHTVVTGGPYRYVRHPGYVGAIVFHLASPIMLDSLSAFIPATLAALLFIVRTALEDWTLHNELDGYQDYARQVRYRLLPGVW